MSERVTRFLEKLVERREEVQAPIELLVGPGLMGAAAARTAGLPIRSLAPPLGERRSNAEDTRGCVRNACQERVELLLFAGGDGTARDILESCPDVPVIGIPCGAKMHSGVFASSPVMAAEITIEFLSAAGAGSVARAEVVDADEEARRAGKLSTRLYGTLLVPQASGKRLPAKATGNRHDDRQLGGACAAVAAELNGDQLCLIGPGTTTARVLEACDVEGSLLGVDAIRAGKLIGRDLDEQGILRVLDGENARLILGVVGGQGMLLGRGNQQLSPTVLRRIDPAQITVLASRDKLLALNPNQLHVDTGDVQLDAALSGWRPVRVGPAEQLMMEVAA